MSIKRITQTEIERASMSGVSNRPSDNTGFGGARMSAEALKERFSALSLLGIKKLNELIDLITADGGASALLEQLMVAPDETLLAFALRTKTEMKDKMSFAEAQNLLEKIFSAGETVKGDIDGAKKEALEALAGDVAAAALSAEQAGEAAEAALNERFSGKYREDERMNLYSGDGEKSTGENGDDAVTGKCNAILNSGGGNKVTGDHNLVSGALNTADAENCIIIGLGNHAKLIEKEVEGKKHTYGHRAALFGRHLISNANDQTWVGRWNVEKDGVLFGVGAGTADDKRFNAFVVYAKGTASVGADPIGPMDVVPKHLLDEATAAISATTGRVAISEKTLRVVEGIISRNEKRITNLEKGISPDPFVTDDTLAYQKDIPHGALPYAEIEKVGGAVTAIESHGKNLVNIDSFNKSILTGITHNGITVKYLPEEDCFLIDGTNTGAADGTGATNITSNYFAIKNIPGTYYTLSAQHISGTMTGGEAYFYAGASNATGAKKNWFSLRFSHSSSDKKQNNYTFITAFWFYLYKGISFDNYKVRFQLEKGSTATEYSKYVGCIERWNIPQAVQSLEGYGEANPDNAEEYNYIDFEKKKFVAYGCLSNGVWVAYDSPRETDVSAYFNNDFIEVEAGGSLVFPNDDEIAVPSTITYMTKEEV